MTAAQFGADFVGTKLNSNFFQSVHFVKSLNSFVIEFDVQLTKDKVPVLFHDIEICVREDPNGNSVHCPLYISVHFFHFLFPIHIF
jgi:hypothetical protein